MRDVSGETRRRMTAAGLVSGWLLIVLLTVTTTRLYGLSVLPPGLWYDEAYYALDAAWVADTHAAQVFFPGNNGREPLMPYLGAVSMSALGQTPYALRLVSALAAILTVAITYRWLVTMFAGDPERRWLAVIAAGGLALSFWYLVMSRTGHRAALLPACLVLANWLFWSAFRRASRHGVGRSWPQWALAGLALGFCQYSYLTARLVPLIFLIFGVAATIVAHRANQSRPICRPALWSGLAVMGLSAGLVFAPLGLYFLGHPDAFVGRSGDVFVGNQLAGGAVTWPQQLLDAVRVFVDGSDPHWRHNLADQAGFSALEVIGFWIGLLVCLGRVRRPAYLFLLVSLLVLWLPALLSVPAVYTLRLSGLLPIYYAVTAVGWVTVARGLLWVFARRKARPAATVGVRATVTVLLLIATAWWALPAYFGRWAQTPMVYSQYNGPLADLADYVAERARDADVLLPLPVYLHPTVHFLLRSQFAETDVRPPLRSDRPALLLEVPDIFLIPGVVAIDRESSLMWLRRDATGSGTAYLLHFPQPYRGLIPPPGGPADPLVVGPTRDRVATLHTYPTIVSFADAAAAASPPVAVEYSWGGQVALTAYRLTPTVVPPGGAAVLDLYWRGITDQPWEYRTFVHILDARGQPVSQLNGISLSEEQRWRFCRGRCERHHRGRYGWGCRLIDDWPSRRRDRRWWDGGGWSDHPGRRQDHDGCNRRSKHGNHVRRRRHRNGRNHRIRWPDQHRDWYRREWDWYRDGYRDRDLHAFQGGHTDRIGQRPAQGGHRDQSRSRNQVRHHLPPFGSGGRCEIPDLRLGRRGLHQKRIIEFRLHGRDRLSWVFRHRRWTSGRRRQLPQHRNVDRLRWHGQTLARVHHMGHRREWEVLQRLLPEPRYDQDRR